MILDSLDLIALEEIAHTAAGYHTDLWKHQVEVEYRASLSQILRPRMRQKQ